VKPVINKKLDFKDTLLANPYFFQLHSSDSSLEKLALGLIKLMILMREDTDGFGSGFNRQPYTLDLGLMQACLGWACIKPKWAVSSHLGFQNGTC
jgi:hypothetical protein